MYKNYIFDLYGTLLDIRTNEIQKTLWRIMADIYASYGADYTPEELRDAYHYLCKSEETRIRKATGSLYPEIDLKIVFLRLLLEAPHTHVCEAAPKAWGREQANAFAYQTANTFRAVSREYCHPYEDTLATLQALKKKRCRLFLLSNAQHVFTMPEIERAGLHAYFDKIYISSDYQIRKPDSSFLKRVLEENHLRKSRTVMVGNDFLTDIQTAMDIGMDSVYLNTDHLDGRERRKLINRMVNRKEGYMPQVIVSGNISELLKEKRK